MILQNLLIKVGIVFDAQELFKDTVIRSIIEDHRVNNVSSTLTQDDPLMSPKSIIT